MRPAVFAVLLMAAFAAVTVREIKNVTTKQLLYSGTAPPSASSASNLFFLFYGVQGVTDRAQLANYPTLVVMGNPGSSSQYLNFGGMGPLLLLNNLTLAANNNTPSTYANLMFIDVLGTGFSFASDPKEIAADYPGLAAQVGYALNAFASEIDFGKGQMVLVGESSWIRLVPFFKLTNIAGVVALSPWSELYAIGKYYGAAGVELNIFTAAEKTSIESTFLNCYLNLKNGKFKEAHQCYDSVLNFVEQKGANRNLWNVALNQSITPTFALVQYYLTQSATVNLYGAPTSMSFEQQTGTLQWNTYVDEAKNYTQNISYYLRDYLDVKLLTIAGTLDYITYYKATRSWMETELNFVESAAFQKLNLTDVTINGTVQARSKAVKQVAYAEVINSGHYLWIDKPLVVNSLLKDWLGVKEEQPMSLRTEEVMI